MIHTGDIVIPTFGTVPDDWGHLESFLTRQQERGREVPPFVEREMRAYLSCGVLACGFLRPQCESCGKDRLLPLSCKGELFARPVADAAWPIRRRTWWTAS